jgi:hypothetical protein
MKISHAFLFILLMTATMHAQTPGKSVRRAPANEQEILQEIQTLETSLREAFEEGNTVWWEQHLDDHYSGLNAEGRVANKSDAVLLYKSPELKYEQIEVSDVAARIFNGDCVIGTGKAAIKGSYGGKDMSGQYYFVHVWVKNGNEFRLASSQLNKVPSQ